MVGMITMHQIYFLTAGRGAHQWCGSMSQRTNHAGITLVHVAGGVE
jgi:hypothetical protein